MEQDQFLRLLPDLETIAECFPGCTLQCSAPAKVYAGVRIYTGQQEVDADRIYLVRRGDGFPVDTHAWISTDDISGAADHICCPGFSREDILDAILSLNARLREQEHQLDSLLFQNAGLQELCELAARLLGNPVYIHDDWFIMIAKSAQVDKILSPEYVMSSEKGFIPRVIIDDFRDDSEYLETYAHRTAQLWEGGLDVPSSLYFNLWDGNVYRGRLLVVQSNHPIRHSDFRLTEVLGQAALMQLHRKQLGEHESRSMDDIMYDLLQGQRTEASELTMLLNMLKWGKEDKFLCVCIQSQQPDLNTVTEHALHSDLFRSFPDSYIMLTGNQQCLILNLTRSSEPRSLLRHKLSPLCRDFCLYAGISSPVRGIRDLHLADHQAVAALNYAFRLHNEKWILSFSECAMDYLVTHLNSPLGPWQMISPDLQALRDYDQEKGTAYFETLREFLLQERDIPRTSEKLIIHRTTLLYRLKKIQSLISADLESPEQRLYLMWSLWVLDREK